MKSHARSKWKKNLSDRQKIIRVFIGSPGGLDEERQAAHEAVTSVNRSHSDHWGLQIRLLGWETALPGFIRPQDKINEDLDKCDYFIGVVWNHWGSKPARGDIGPTSGFEEEYKRAEIRIRAGHMKDMALYFKTVTVPVGFVPDENLQKVMDFRRKCIDEKMHFFKEFSDPSGFRELVREKLEEIGWRETDITQQEQQPDDQSKRVSPQPDRAENVPKQDASFFVGSARTFVLDLLERSSEWDGTSPIDIARLRLLGSAYKRSGNDDDYIGTHDANLIWKHYRQKELSYPEVRALIDAGIVGFQHQNVPLWTWIAREEHPDRQWNRVNVLAAFGTSTEKKHAIEILGLLREGVPSFDVFDRKRVLDSWLSEGVDSHVFDAAIRFLAQFASLEDSVLIEEIAAAAPPHHRVKIEEGLVGIFARIDVNVALRRVVESEVDKIDPALAASMFSSHQSIKTETALRCLSAKPDAIRLGCMRILAERDEITMASAETLLTDSNHEIRLLAAEHMRRNGAQLPEDVARKALRIVKPARSLFVLTSESDDTFYERYVISGLSEATFGELRGKLDEGKLLDHRVMSALLSRYGSRLKSFMRENLKDGFHAYFEDRLARDVAKGILTDEMSREVRGFEGPIISRICTIALTSLVKHEDEKDMALVRTVLDSTDIAANAGILKYLGKFGDWSDVDRIKELGERNGRSLSLLDFARTELPENKAAALLSIGKTRLADTLALDLSTQIRVSLAKQMPATLLKGLRDEILVRELERPIDEYRVVIAIRCVQALSKARLKTLLDRYISGTGHSYYNSIHWLDLGVALPSRTARVVAEGMLMRH